MFLRSVTWKHKENQCFEPLRSEKPQKTNVLSHCFEHVRNQQGPRGANLLGAEMFVLPVVARVEENCGEGFGDSLGQGPAREGRGSAATWSKGPAWSPSGGVGLGSTGAAPGRSVAAGRGPARTGNPRGVGPGTEVCWEDCEGGLLEGSVFHQLLQFLSRAIKLG